MKEFLLQAALPAQLRDGSPENDASFEVVGAGQPIDLAIRSVRKGGQVPFGRSEIDAEDISSAIQTTFG